MVGGEIENLTWKQNNMTPFPKVYPLSRIESCRNILLSEKAIHILRSRFGRTIWLQISLQCFSYLPFWVVQCLVGWLVMQTVNQWSMQLLAHNRTKNLFLHLATKTYLPSTNFPVRSPPIMSHCHHYTPQTSHNFLLPSTPFSFSCLVWHPRDLITFILADGGGDGWISNPGGTAAVFVELLTCTACSLPASPVDRWPWWWAWCCGARPPTTWSAGTGSQL